MSNLLAVTEMIWTRTPDDILAVTYVSPCRAKFHHTPRSMYLIAINGPALTAQLTTSIAATSVSYGTWCLSKSGFSTQLTVHFCAHLAVALCIVPGDFFTDLDLNPTPEDVALCRMTGSSQLVARVIRRQESDRWGPCWALYTALRRWLQYRHQPGADFRP
jgi:hypothetical protein